MEASDVAACWEANAETWTRHARAGYDLYRDAQNTPAFFTHLPDIDGLDGLDIGCGEGSNTRKLAEAGASVTARAASASNGIAEALPPACTRELRLYAPRPSIGCDAASRLMSSAPLAYPAASAPPCPATA